MQRFTASMFNVQGDAIDSGGESCSALACPRCHLEIPRAVIELQPVSISIVGAPGSGKSTLLAAATEALQRRFARHQMMFRDAQADLNKTLAEARQVLFWNDQPNQGVTLPATAPEGHTYESVHLDGRDVTYPRPLMFRWMPTLEHPLAASRSTAGRVVCVHDNSGKHFLPGSVRGAETDHLRYSNALIFLFDPTQHTPLQPKLQVVSSDPQLTTHSRLCPQTDVLNEVLERIRATRSVAGVDRISMPIIIAVTKSDIWQEDLQGEPLPDDLELSESSGRASIDLSAITEISSRLRSWLSDACPELVHAAESQVEQVVYLPTSSLGTSPKEDAESGQLVVTPASLAPRMADLPLLLALHLAVPRLLPSQAGVTSEGSPE